MTTQERLRAFLEAIVAEGGDSPSALAHDPSFGAVLLMCFKPPEFSISLVNRMEPEQAAEILDAGSKLGSEYMKGMPSDACIMAIQALCTQDQKRAKAIANQWLEMMKADKEPKNKKSAYKMLAQDQKQQAEWQKDAPILDK